MRPSDNSIYIVFCQAAADVKHILRMLPELRERTGDDIILAVRIPELNRFFKEKRLGGVRIVLLKNRKLRTRIDRYVARLSLFFSAEALFFRKKITEAFFFSRFYDYVTFSYLYQLRKKSSHIVYVNHYDEIIMSTLEKARNGDAYVRKKLKKMREATGIDFDACYLNGHTVIELPETFMRDVIAGTVSPGAGVGVTEKIEVAETERVALFLETDYRRIRGIDEESYRATTESVIEELKKRGYSLVLKAHPRLGASAFVTGYADGILDKSVPAELFDLQKGRRNVVLGLSSTALGDFADRGIETIALVDLYKFLSDAEKTSHMKYIKNTSSRIRIVESLDAFRSALDEIDRNDIDQ